MEVVLGATLTLLGGYAVFRPWLQTRSDPDAALLGCREFTALFSFDVPRWLSRGKGGPRLTRCRKHLLLTSYRWEGREQPGPGPQQRAR